MAMPLPEDFPEKEQTIQAGPSPEEDSGMYFDTDYDSFEELLHQLESAEPRVLSSSLPEHYEYYGNTAKNPLVWGHLIDAVLAHKGFDTKFTHDAYLAGRKDDPAALIPTHVGVYLDEDQLQRKKDITTIIIIENHPYFALFCNMTSSGIFSSILETRPNEDGDYTLGFADRLEVDETELSEIGARYDYEREPEKRRIDTPKDKGELLKSGLAQRAFLTSMLFWRAEGYTHAGYDEEYEAMYEKLRQEGFTPFSPEEIYGFAEGLVGDIFDRYPGIKPEPTED